MFRKWICTLLALCLLLAGLPAVTAEEEPMADEETVFSAPVDEIVEEAEEFAFDYEESEEEAEEAFASVEDEYFSNATYTVNGVQVYATMVADPGNGQCWAYANSIYKIIWGVNFDSSFAGGASTGNNLLKNLGDSDRTLNAAHLQSFVSQAALGSVIRIGGCTSSCSHWNDDGLACGHSGHSLVIVAKSNTGFTTFERLTGPGRREKEWTWDSFCSAYSGYPYIKYIKWPNAPEYSSIPSYYIDPIVYNADYYRSRYTDLQAAFGNDNAALMRHWVDCGISEGRVASPVFDAKYYLNNNSGVAQAFGATNYARAIQHFIEYGFNELRHTSEEFFISYYRDNYKDLQNAFGDDSYRYYKHYIDSGRAEGRIANRRLKIKLDANGGTVTPSEINITNFTPYGSLPTPTRSGYSFEGWFTEISGGTRITAESIVDYHQCDTLYAHWKLNAPDPTLAPSGIAIDQTHFPDANFRSYVSGNIDSDRNGTLSNAEIASVTRLDISDKNIANLQGIQYLTALDYLDCGGNKLTDLDVSKLTSLRILHCEYNRLTNLNIRNCVALEYLYCSNNKLKSLNAYRYLELRELYCYSNQLTSLNVTVCPTLGQLVCYENQLDVLDIAGCDTLLECVYITQYQHLGGRICYEFEEPTHEWIIEIDDSTSLINEETTLYESTAATPIRRCTITVKNQVYTGKAIKPNPVVEYDGKPLVKGTDYKVSYKNNKAIGLATITIKGIGNYTGSVKQTFKINPKPVALTKLTAGKQKLTVQWKKGVGDITGYQLQYSLKKNMASPKTVTVKGIKTVKKTIKSLKSGKTYYVRIRAYKKVSGKTYYSAWSKALKKKVK